MSEISSFKDVNEVIGRYRTPNIKYNLDRIRHLMDILGNPQNSYKVVHIAGTSGKTSTAYYTAALLGQTGKKVGLTVSPHVDEINERVQINLIPLDEKTFCSELTKFLKLIEQADSEPSYFELLIAFVFWEFAQQKVDYAVIEVGLGGLLDCTNVIDRADKVSVITDIGLDHTKILGNDLASIAAQKAGIILPSSVTFSYRQSDEVMKVFREVAYQKKATLNEIEIGQEKSFLNDLPDFQKRNFDLAYSAVAYVVERDNLEEIPKTGLKLAADTYIPARMEITTYRGKQLIFDGSHNQQKLQTLGSALKTKYKNAEIAVLIGLLEEKDDELHAALAEIKNIANFVVTTSFYAGQDIPKKAMNPDYMTKVFREMGVNNVISIADPKDAFEALLTRSEPVLLVTGSFYLLNHVRPLVKRVS